MPSQMQAAQRTLSELQERIAGEDAAGALNWFRVDQILESAVATANTRFYALQILESAIKYRWKTLPPEQQVSGRPTSLRDAPAPSLRAAQRAQKPAVCINDAGNGHERNRAGRPRIFAIRAHGTPSSFPTLLVHGLCGGVRLAQVGIKNFIVNLVIHKSSSEEVFRRERVFMTKLNVILVQIVKQEWPVSQLPLLQVPTADSPRLV